MSEQGVDALIAIAPDGGVTVRTGKVELGTGIATALVQIVAEELDVPVERVTLLSGDTATTPDQGTTAGSKTLQVTGMALRQAAAEIRLVLLRRASSRLEVPVDELEVVDGVVRATDDPEWCVGYGQLAGEPFAPEVDGTAVPKSPDLHTVVGQSVPRVDLLAKVTGGEAFLHDLRLPGMRHGRVIRPFRRTTAGVGRIVSIDDSALANMPGVEVVRRGSFLGVVAEREEVAIAAAQALRVTWDDLPPLPDQASEHERLLQAPATIEPIVETGDVESALTKAPVRHSATYTQPWQAHASLGPSCAVADVGPEEATVWSSSQYVHGLVHSLAPLLGLPPETIHVIYKEGAGCYGHNGSDDVTADAALLSQAVGAPVRVQWMREEEFAWEPKGTSMRSTLEAALDDEGKIVAWRHDVWTPTHTNRPGTDPGRLLAARQLDPPIAPGPGRNGGGNRNAPTNYVVPNCAVTMHWITGPTLHQSSLRSLGGFHNGTANEIFMDELAHLAGSDPVAFRLRHLDDPRAIVVLEEVARQSGWDTPVPPSDDPGVRRGRGVAFCRYENDWSYVATVAEVAVRMETGEIRVEKVWVAHDCGLVVNPDGVRNQVEGNILQGLSRALKEEVTWDAAGVTSLTYGTYPILTFSETPEIEVILIDRPDEPVWGAGEPAICTAAAAVSNAVFAATGARLRSVPYTPDRVLAALQGM